MKLIKTFEAACKALKLDPATVLPATDNLPNGKEILAAAKLFIIVQAQNGKRVFDWNDWNQRKYYPWFDMEKTEDNPGGFRLHYVDFYSASSNVGSRLCFHTREEAEHIAETFIDLYRDLMTT